MRLESSTNWVLLFLRYILGILFTFSGIAFLLEISFFIKPMADLKPWFTVNYPSLPAKAIAAALVLIGVLFFSGFRTKDVSLLSIGLIMIIHTSLLINNPFYNTLNHIVPFFLISLIIFFLSQNHQRTFLGKSFNWKSWEALDHSSFISLCLRLFIGNIFIFQGYRSLSKGPMLFAEKLYVVPFKDTILPESLLWVAGVINPFLQFIGGIFLILGFMTYQTLITLCFFMLTILLGHMFIDPYETNGKLTSFGLNNFLFLISALYYVSQKNKYSIDNYLPSRYILKRKVYKINS